MTCIDTCEYVTGIYELLICNSLGDDVSVSVLPKFGIILIFVLFVFTLLNFVATYLKLLCRVIVIQKNMSDNIHNSAWSWFAITPNENTQGFVEIRVIKDLYTPLENNIYQIW